jgi:hypothetical protein
MTLVVLYKKEGITGNLVAENHCGYYSNGGIIHFAPRFFHLQCHGDKYLSRHEVVAYKTQAKQKMLRRRVYQNGNYGRAN